MKCSQIFRRDAHAVRKLEWPRFADASLDRRIGELYDELRKADFAGDKEAVATLGQEFSLPVAVIGAIT